MNYPWIKQANTIFTYVLLVQGLMSLVIAFIAGGFAAAIIGSIVIMAVPLFLIFSAPFSAATRYAVGIGVQLMTALHIQLAIGLTEIHFEIFVMLAFLSIYRDWKVILASVVTIAVHHVLFYALQVQEMPLYIFEDGHLTFSILVLHAFFAVAEGAVLMYVAAKSHKEAIAGYTMSNSVNSILGADGKVDLTLDIPGNYEELEAFRRLVMSFKNLIGESKGIANEVSHIALDVDELSRSVSSAVDNSTQRVHSIATSIEEMSVTTQDVAQRMSENSQLSSQNSENTALAKETISKSSVEIENLNTMLQGAAGTIEQLSQMCNQIDTAMQSIKAISEQTNLLALNAAIESARAGEHGRGFAVVADEVRQLATTTGKNAEEITSITSQLIDEAGNAVEKMHQCVETATDSAEAAGKALQRIDEISGNTTQLDLNIESVATAAEEQSVVSNDIADSSQQLLTSSQKQHDDVSKSAVEMSKLQSRIADLTGELEKFAV